MVKFEAFMKSVESGETPVGLDEALLSLWWDGRGDWERAHELAQSAGTRAGDWVHAYLHRKEGDEGNAGYWYSRGGKPPFNGSLEQEWVAMVRELLED